MDNDQYENFKGHYTYASRKVGKKKQPIEINSKKHQIHYEKKPVQLGLFQDCGTTFGNLERILGLTIIALGPIQTSLGVFGKI